MPAPPACVRPQDVDPVMTADHAISDSSPLGIFVGDAQGKCTYSNAAYAAISGRPPKENLGRCWQTAVHPDDHALGEWPAAAAHFSTELRLLRPDGTAPWVRIHGAAMDDGVRAPGRVFTFEDISTRKAAEMELRDAEEALFEEKERAQVTLNSIGDAVLTTDLKGRVTYLNVVAEAMTGWSGCEALGRPLTEVFRIVDGTSREPAVDPAQRAIRENRTVGLAINSVLLRRDGSESAIEDSAAPIHARSGAVSGAVIVFHDVSDSRAMARKMAHLAQHDFLTDLPNRLLLTERLAQAIGLARRRRKQVALLFLDLDFFKHINDSLGHAVGDQLLQAVAERLRAQVRTTDTVCRQGGDEFVILLADIDQPQAASQVADKLLLAFAESLAVAGHALHIGLSIGISIFPDDGEDVDALMRNADTAMYHAKANGRSNYQFFRTDMNTRAVRRLFVENALRRALREGEFILHYQPQIDLESGVITGAEALIRWQDPELGLVLPAQFVPIAEECGLIVPIGRWVLGEVCRQLRVWQDAGLPVPRMAVNISAVEFRHQDFLAGVAGILQESGVAPGLLEMELTESVLMHNVESSAQVLGALKTMGMQLAIDDFGTGYSSLSYLMRFPIDTLKIDQSFVRDIADAADAATIISAVIGMGRKLRQRVIAEGVETSAQLAFLRAQCCAEGQGFQFSQPLSAEDFACLLHGQPRVLTQTSSAPPVSA